MASPQKEKGFTPIANEILDETCRYKFNGAQLRIIIKIWRLTYGYSRKDHDFSITFLSQVTGLSESAVKKELRFLINSQVLVVTKDATRSKSRMLSFEKDYEKWTVERSEEELKEQLDLFDQGHDCIPNNEETRSNEGHDCTPLEGHDCIPNSDYEGHDCTPIKRKKILKKSIKEKKELFDQFYTIYPRKISRKKAEESWNRLCAHDEFDPEQAINNTLNFLETCKLLETETKYIPHPATFLNQKRYEDYPVIDPEGLAQSKSTFDQNKELLLGGDQFDRATSEIPALQSFGSLPGDKDS